jgi:hypothetical protein
MENPETINFSELADKKLQLIEEYQKTKRIRRKSS